MELRALSRSSGCVLELTFREGMGLFDQIRLPCEGEPILILPLSPPMFAETKGNRSGLALKA